LQLRERPVSLLARNAPQNIPADVLRRTRA
jgi:hypothetical protein